MSGLPTHTRVRRIDRDQREGPRALPTESARCPLCPKFLSKNWSPVIVLNEPIRIGDAPPCFVVHERCYADRDRLTAERIAERIAARQAAEERSRAMRRKYEEGY